MAKWTVKGIVDDEPKSKQETEQAVLDKAVEKGDIEPEAAGQETEDIPKINLNDLKGETTEVVKEVAEETTKENTEEADSPLELIQENEEDNTNEAGVERVVEDTTTPQEQKEVQPQVQTQTLPENINKLVEFMENTGGSLEDYVKINRDVSELPDGDVLREFYSQSKPWDNTDINEYMEDQFSFDEDDDPREIRAKKRAFKEELYNARKFFETNKEKYYADLKLSRKQEIPQDYQEAYSYYNEYKQGQEANEQLSKVFLDRTNNVFSDSFKGFDFQVGDNKFRYKVTDVAKTKEAQTDISNFVKPYLNDKGEISDAKGYHKALFAARNADKLAQHFYEQGRADALRTSAKEAKNINMDPRQEGTIKTSTGQKFKVVSGNSSSKLKIKLKQ